MALKRIIKMGWQGFTRDGGLVIANIFILVLTIFLITSLFFLKEISQFIIYKVEEKVDISVYFKEGANELDILDVKEEISKIPEVKDVKYASKEDALGDFVQRHKEDLVLMKSLEEIGTNPFLASLNIKTYDSTQYASIAKLLEGPDFENLVEKVDYYQRKPVIERIFSFTRSMEKLGLLLSILLVFLSFLIVLNTIRLSIYSSREEVETQRLVGASNWFIRGPFLVQGIMAGIISAFICFLLFTSICWVFSPQIAFLFPDLDIWLYFTNSFLTIILIQLGTGIFLGIISSTIAIRNYLKV